MLDMLIVIIVTVAIVYAIYYLLVNHPRTFTVGYVLLILGFLYSLFFTDIGKNYMSLMKAIFKNIT